MSADTPGQAPGATPPAGGAELSIPKHRFDEVANELKRLRDEVSQKDQLYSQERQRYLAALQPQSQEPELTPEDTGLDPTMHKAVLKAAERIASKVVAKERQMVEGYVGQLAARTEKAELMAKKGAGVEKYMPEILKRQQQHAQMTGGFLPADVALAIIESEEKDAKIRDLEARLAAKPGAEPPPQAQASAAPQGGGGGVPPAAGTREIPGGGPSGGGGGQKAYSELSIEEMEARLEEQFKAGQRA